MVKMSNYFKSFRTFKIFYYLQLKFLNKNITHGFKKKWWILVQAKSFWSLLKTFLINKKIPCIHPLYHNNKFISNFRDKADLFNNFFAQQCTLIDNASATPARLYIKTTKTLSKIPVTRADIAKIIKNLDPNKAYGHDMISIPMLKLCGDSVWPPLELTFKSCLESGTFPSKSKKSNVVPVHKKGHKQSLKSYRQMSLLPIYGKIFERWIQQNVWVLQWKRFNFS